MGSFSKKRLSTRMTFCTAAVCMVIIIVLSILSSLYILKYVHIVWPNVVGKRSKFNVRFVQVIFWFGCRYCVTFGHNTFYAAKF